MLYLELEVLSDRDRKFSVPSTQLSLSMSMDNSGFGVATTSYILRDWRLKVSASRCVTNATASIQGLMASSCFWVEDEVS